MVFCDRNLSNVNSSKVIFDDKAGTISAMSKLIEMGYTKIAHLAGYSTTNVGKERIDGYISALSENKIKVKKHWIVEGGFNFEDGYIGFKKLLKYKSMPEIIFTVNNMVALGAYKAAREAGLKIPSDIGFFGFGFCEHTDLFDPPMTVINQDPRKIGEIAAMLIIDEIASKGKNKKTIIRLPTTFLWRKSVERKSF